MLEIFKRILRDFFKEMSIFKTILVFFISFLVAILTILEPFFIKAVIESIEEFYKV
jgi:ABC-type bacteriocin/lantibiotic exporter with double-glycine peptidase domain